MAGAILCQTETERYHRLATFASVPRSLKDEVYLSSADHQVKVTLSSSLFKTHFCVAPLNIMMCYEVKKFNHGYCFKKLDSFDTSCLVIRYARQNVSLHVQADLYGHMPTRRQTRHVTCIFLG